MGELIIAGRRFNIDAPLKNMYETGWDATIERCVPMKPGGLTKCEASGGISAFSEKAKNRGARRYSTRPALRRYGNNPPLEAVRAVIRQFVIHHDGLYDSAICWHVLHNERGLSCHFLIDNDGTIYQTLDLALSGFHASEFNPMSVGVELCNRGDAKKEPHYYDNVSRYPDRRDVKAIQISGYKILAYDYTKPQYASMAALARGLAKLLPNLPLDYPQEAPGKQAWGVMEPAKAWAFSGYIGHYHLTNRKWDPGPFDFKGFCEKIRGTLCFPLWTGKAAPADPKTRPEIPESIDELRARTDELYDANEKRAEGGFFPVGPWGEARLWHGGVHLPGPRTGPAPLVYAPFPGRLVAARMGTRTAIGSVDFVLLRHDMSVGAETARFFSLYMHLHDETREAQPAPPWMTRESWKQHGKPGEVVLLDDPVEAGEVLGRMGKAGPTIGDEDLMKPQLHFAIFSRDRLFAELGDTEWNPVDGVDGGRFSTEPDVNSPIDIAPRDGKLTRRELVEFFLSSGDRQGMRKLVTFHVSEWTAEPSWVDALTTTNDLGLTPKQIAELVEEQITPGLWWDDRVALHAGLPTDGLVYHYHPIRFIQWINEKMLETAAASPVAVIDPAQTSVVTGMTSDLGEGTEDHDGDMISDLDLDPNALDHRIENRHLVEGFAGEDALLMGE
jgi:N-acetylmuramoyl-L-alanine amidase